MASRGLATVFALALLSLGPAASAARAQRRPPARPKLEPGEDRNDWRSYLYCGTKAQTYKRAGQCFYWAARLDPARPEPLYAQWMLSDYEVDSLRREALWRDPFVYHARVMVVSERKYGLFTSPRVRAWGALGAGNYFEAARWFYTVVEEDSSDLDALWGIAVAQYYRQRFDSAALHVRALESALRRERERTVQGVYAALDFLGYMEGSAWLGGRRVDSARAALERSVSENVAFYPARMALGDLALERGDTAVADELWGQAVEVQQGSAYVRGRYGAYLRRRGRYPEAERELRFALAREPYWVDARWELAQTIEAQGPTRAGDAAVAFRDYLVRAPVADSTRRATAQARVTAPKGP